MAVYHASDLHLGHRNIIKWREGFDDLDHHDTTMVERVLETVGKRDKLFLHGDICFNREKLNLVQDIVDRVDNAVLIMGNHDNERSKAPTLEDFVNIFGYKRIHSMLEYKGCWLTHAPLHPDELRGKMNIHGHTHAKNMNDPKYFNVSMENLPGGKPIEHTLIRQMFMDMNSGW